jgi:hypothetical protein
LKPLKPNSHENKRENNQTTKGNRKRPSGEKNVGIGARKVGRKTEKNNQKNTKMEAIASKIEAISEPLTKEVFTKIFDYGHENSGSLMWDRFVNQFGCNVALFEDHLCTIDRRKWDKHFQAIELKALKLESIKRMIDNNLDMQERIRKNLTFSRLQIMEFFDSKFMQHDTILNVYLDFVEFLSPKQFVEFEQFRDNKYKE